MMTMTMMMQKDLISIYVRSSVSHVTVSVSVPIWKEKENKTVGNHYGQDPNYTGGRYVWYMEIRMKFET